MSLMVHFTGGNQLGNVASHLYFVPVIIGLYLVFPVLWKYRNKIFLLLILSFTIQIICQIARYYAFIFEIPYAKEARAFFPLFIGYFVLGIFCALNIAKFESLIRKYTFLIIIISILSFILANIFSNEITFQLYYLTSIPTVFFIFRKISNNYYSNLATLGYYVYLIHHFILDYLVKYLHNTFVSPSIFSIFITLLTYGLCCIISFLYLNIKSKVKPLTFYNGPKKLDTK